MNTLVEFLSRISRRLQPPSWTNASVWPTCADRASYAQRPATVHCEWDELEKIFDGPRAPGS